MAPHVPAGAAAVTTHRDQQRRRAPAQRLVCEFPRHRVARHALTATAAAPLIRVEDSARQHGAIWVKALAGDFKPGEAKKLVEKYFGKLKAGDPVPPVVVQQPVITAEKRVTVTDRIAMLYNKRIAFTGTADETEKSEIRYVREFIAGGRGTLDEDIE